LFHSVYYGDEKDGVLFEDGIPLGTLEPPGPLFDLEMIWDVEA
jgi:hypothetical protein